MLKWPDAKTVLAALRQWAEKIVRSRPEVVRIGFFGSYARGEWGVGSDLDLLILVVDSDLDFEMRASAFDTLELPVPTDVLVYTEAEWHALKSERSFLKRLDRETVWVYPPDHR